MRELSALGGTVAGYRRLFELRYRNHERLRADEYPMDRLLAGEAFRELIVQVTRRGQPRHWVHQIRTMVLTAPDGRPDCLVLILNDETERFNAEERFERAFAANPAPAIIARLSDMRYVKVNHGFMELTGYARDALIGRSMHEIDVLRGAERRDLALARLHSGATIPQMEGCLSLPDGREKTVLLGGQPLEIGDQACMLFTFADLHPRQQAQEALRQSEERFAKAFRMAPGPMAIMALDGLIVLDVNDAFTAATGWRREEIIGRSHADVEIWAQGEHREHLERQIKQTGHVRSVDIQLRTKTGGPGDYLLSRRNRDDPGPALRAQRHARHHRAQADRNRTARRHPVGHAGHVLDRPKDRGKTHQPDPGERRATAARNRHAAPAHARSARSGRARTIG